MTPTQELDKILVKIVKSSHHLYIYIAIILIALMQVGFALIEAGSVNKKNVNKFIIRNVFNTFFGLLVYGALGWSICFAENGNWFWGGSSYFGLGTQTDEEKVIFYYNFVFAMMSASIVSGAIVGRYQCDNSFIYIMAITGWVYPTICHWAWDENGWLTYLGFQDFGGSSIVHLLGGSFALVACVIFGPRYGRFSQKMNSPNNRSSDNPRMVIIGYSIILFVLTVMGTFLIQKEERSFTSTAINILIGGMGASVIVPFISTCNVVEREWEYDVMLKGALCGSISICGGCNIYPTWISLLLGFLTGFIYVHINDTIMDLRIDDPTNAIAIHLTGGLCGIIYVSIFHNQYGLLWNIYTEKHLEESWKLVGVSFLGALSIIVWSSIWSAILFYIYKNSPTHRSFEQNRIRARLDRQRLRRVVVDNRFSRITEKAMASGYFGASRSS